MNLIRGKIPALIDKENIRKDDIGRWIAYLLIRKKQDGYDNNNISYSTRY